MFQKFINLYRANESEWRVFLDDKGVGNPPMEYLIAFEEGLREYAAYVHCLGTRPLRSRTHWEFKVARAKKREPYIVLARYLMGLSAGCAQWDNFILADYFNRAKLAKTFLVRHLPLSNGKDEINFNGQFNFDWEKHACKAPARVKKEPNPKEYTSVSTAPPSMIFDVEMGCMVPM